MAPWKVKRDDSEWEIASSEALRAEVKATKIRPDDYVFNPVLEQWVYAKDVAELSDLMGSLGTKCPYCGSFSVKKVEGLQGNENALGCVLVAFLFIPAVIYYWDKTRHPYCSSCKRRVPNS